MKQKYTKPSTLEKEVDTLEMICVSAKLDASTSADASEAETKPYSIWEFMEEQER
ncbi:MAG: hypothetical protein PUH24_06895 [Prevotellaceae bacterium]|nr:hypothetical protein [Prevotella sp.]MDD7257975.1 hypothetical protein [Prevotellaceae bacterium]MDY6131459.1 hypothetical protein [Prevotella sp.]